MLTKKQRRAKMLKARKRNWQLRENHQDKMDELVLAGSYRWEWLGKRLK